MNIACAGLTEGQPGVCAGSGLRNDVLDDDGMVNDSQGHAADPALPAVLQLEHALVFGLLCIMALYIAKVRPTSSNLRGYDCPPAAEPRTHPLPRHSEWRPQECFRIRQRGLQLATPDSGDHLSVHVEDDAEKSD